MGSGLAMEDIALAVGGAAKAMLRADAGAAAGIAAAAVSKARRDFGGRQFYIPLHGAAKGERHPLLAGIAAAAADAAQVILGAATEEAIEAADAAAAYLATVWAGRPCYIPNSDKDALEARDAAILHEWRGGARFDELAPRFGMSEQRARQIVNERRAEERARGGGIHAI